MALIKCPECGKEVSDTSYKCPSCGFVIKEPKRSITGNIFKFLFVGFNGLMLLTIAMMFFGISQSEATENAGAVGALGTGVAITIWIVIGLPLGVMSYITRAKSGN